MPIPAKQFFKDLEEGRIVATVNHCVACKKPLQPAITGIEKTTEGFICSDCYYEELGALLEQSPLPFRPLRP